MRIGSLMLLASGFMSACDSDNDREPSDTDPMDTDTDTEPTPTTDIPISLRTRAAFGTEPANCGQSYNGVGTLDSRVRLVDFKVYLHDVVLITPRGREYPVELAGTPPWSNCVVTLLDFATDVGTCRGGDGTNNRIEGIAPEVPVAAVRFTLGIPRDLSTAPLPDAEPPLDVPEMYLNETFGRYHGQIAIQAEDAEDLHRSVVHTTGCVTPSNCTSDNTLTVTVEDFTDLETSEIVFDLAEVLRRNDMGGEGCRGLPADPACQTFFVSWGLGATGPEWIYAD